MRTHDRFPRAAAAALILVTPVLLGNTWSINYPMPNSTFPVNGPITGTGNAPASTDCIDRLVDSGDNTIDETPFTSNSFGGWYQQIYPSNPPWTAANNYKVRLLDQQNEIVGAQVTPIILQ
jgi:hypothetical protein